MKHIYLLFLVIFSHSSVFAQGGDIRGTVRNQETNEPLAGISVLLKGTSTVAATGADGKFVIRSSSNRATLIFQSVGYKAQEVEAQANQSLNILLEEDINILEEVVAIGYGTAKRKELTGSIASVDAQTISAAPVSSALEAIQGRVAGLNISSTEGSPDAELTVRVRGGGSITQDNSPLYIVDGFPVSSISDIAPNDIETIDILKDASSTAIYGSRGANGVIIVTTKSGKAGKTNINYAVFSGIKNLAKKLNVLDPEDYISWAYERALLRNSPEDYTDYFGNWQDMDLYKNVPQNNWQEIVFGRTGTSFNQNININGGSAKTKYAVSHNYINDKAIMLLSGYQRHNLNFKLNHKLYDNLTLDLGARFSDTKISGGGANEINEKSSTDSRLKFAMIYPTLPIANLTEMDDVSETDASFNLYHPVISISDNDQLVRRRQYNFNGAITYEPVQNLRLRSEIGYDDYRNNSDRYYGLTTYYVRTAGAHANQPILGTTNTDRNTLRNTNTINYDFKDLFSTNHSLNWLVGQEYITIKENYSAYESRGFPKSFDFDKTRKLTGQGTPITLNNFFQPNDALLSFFSRANYSYKSKYLFAATFRADGSSKFYDGNKWGYFPSVSAAWRLSDETFMEDTKRWLSDLKIRASYGEAGNNRIPAGQINQEYQVNSEIWINGASSYWAPSTTMANKDLKWETTVTRNIGLDASLLNNRLNFTAEAYLNTTKDLLILFPISGVGYNYQYRNLGDTENKGLEFSTHFDAYRSKNFDFTVAANISFNRNQIKSLGGLEKIEGDLTNTGWASNEILGDYTATVGGQVGMMYGYISDGRYEVSDFKGYIDNKWELKDDVASSSAIVGTIRPGSMKLKNINDDNVVNAEDRAIIGNANPKHTGGFSLSSRIFDFDLAAYFNWSYGNDVYNANKIEYTQTSKFHSRNMTEEMATGKRWTNLRADGTISNDPNELQAMNANTNMWSPLTDRFIFSDWAVEDGSFLRLATLTVGYTLPKELSRRMKMEKLRLYASGYNLHIWTNYTGFDPEVSTRRKSPLTPGVDYSAYPRSRSFVFGLNVNF